MKRFCRCAARRRWRRSGVAADYAIKVVFALLDLRENGDFVGLTLSHAGTFIEQLQGKVERLSHENVARLAGAALLHGGPRAALARDFSMGA